jgi:hypothetical protein
MTERERRKGEKREEKERRERVCVEEGGTK